MPITLLPNEQIRLTSTLIDYNPDTGQEEPVDPTSVKVEIYLWNTTTKVYDLVLTVPPPPDVIIETFPGSFYYDWTPTSEGKYQIDFVAVVNINVTIRDRRIFYVGAINTTSTLITEKTYNFLGELEPMYISPDEVLRYYPTGDPVEIALLIHRYSEQVEELLGQEPLTEVTQEVHDYILAATLCDLTKIYFFDGGMGGFSRSDNEEFTLGDLTVRKGSSSGNGNNSSNNTNAAQAGTWCEMAAILKTELQFRAVSIRTFVKASAWESPVRARVNGKKFASCGCTRGRHTCSSNAY